MVDKKKASKAVSSKADIVSQVAEKLDSVSKTVVAEVLDLALEAIKNTIAKGEKVVLVGFGSFKPGSRKARVGRNPQTGAEIQIAASNTVGFTSGKSFKDLLNKK